MKTLGRCRPAGAFIRRHCDDIARVNPVENKLLGVAGTDRRANGLRHVLVKSRAASAVPHLE